MKGWKKMLEVKSKLILVETEVTNIPTALIVKGKVTSLTLHSSNLELRNRQEQCRQQEC